MTTAVDEAQSNITKTSKEPCILYEQKEPQLDESSKIGHHQVPGQTRFVDEAG